MASRKALTVEVVTQYNQNELWTVLDIKTYVSADKRFARITADKRETFVRNALKITNTRPKQQLRGEGASRGKGKYLYDIQEVQKKFNALAQFWGE